MTEQVTSAWDGLLRLHQQLLRRPGVEFDDAALQPLAVLGPADLHPHYAVLDAYRPVDLDGFTALEQAASLDELAASHLDEALLAIIAAEGPVHGNVLAARLLTQMEQSRSSARLRGTIQERLTGLRASGAIVQQGDFSALGVQLRTPPYRDWRTQTERLRRLDHVHDRELMLALLRAVDRQEGISEQEAMNAGLHRIGFIRLTASARERLRAPLDALLAASLVESRAGALWLGRQAFLR